MARGQSGRIVLEIDRETKNSLYDSLQEDEKTLKEWFLERVSEYLETRNQLTFMDELKVAEEKTRYNQ